MNTKVAEKAVQFVAAASALSDRLAGELAGYRAKEKQAADKQDAVLQLLLESGCVQPHQKEAAAAMLSDHSACMDLLVNSVDRLNTYKEAAERVTDELGHPARDKQANAGGRQKKASDQAFLRILQDPYA